MRIFITNDDGYKAKGIHVLARIMSSFGEVTVIAPKYHQSAMGMAVSLGFKKMVYKRLPEEGPGTWSYLDATPASCIKFGLNNDFLEQKPDAVVCGINHGSNAATAACYSATLGAAEEGALNGVPAIGVSVDSMHPDADFGAVEKYFPEVFKRLMDSWPKDTYGLLYNVNFPGLPASDIKGVRVAHQGRAHWIKEFRPWEPAFFAKYGMTEELFGKLEDKPEEPGETAYMMVGDFVDDETETGEADHRLNDEGYITIAPLNLDKTDYGDLERLRRLHFSQDFL